MERKMLVREAKRLALLPMEDAARTEDEFRAVIKQWDHNDENEARRVRDHEMQRVENTLEVGYTHGMIIPAPISHPAWLEVIKGDFLPMVFDNADEMWQIIGDWDVAKLVKSLTKKQTEILFLRVVRKCTNAQVACHHEKTDRATRKLYAATIDSIRNKLAPLVREQIKTNCPTMTKAKQDFLFWYDVEKAVEKDKSADGRKSHE